ncbi:YHS domain-containing (seleno)protein [uncultured Maricaulis sp.]|uniref:YHS domain-containing (seleno)protein n=1 Tax=uncultured Maricaulis sp. TaxID=174710 RepID=UPI0030DB8BDB|tara:strand:+ start:1580 stop:2083 length:504 start_codon:yes stop_codon:yes gene_type:complete
MIRLPAASWPARAVFALFGLIALLVLPAGYAHAGEPYTDHEGRALSGYDAVSYFTGAGPLMGLETITAEHDGATWWFASEADRTLFLADPALYAPAYDGHCAFALADGRKVRSDPLAWEIVDGRLYLNFSPAIHRRWQQDIPGYLAQSEAHWPALESEPAARRGRWF